MESIANALNTGAVLEDRYTIEAILGEGGFGITYKAHDNKLDCIVVIKEFLPNDFAARGTDSITVQSRTNRGDDFEYGLKSFLEEARTLAKFQHANIVAVTNFIEANGTAYFVMNYAEGIDLSAWLKARSEPLDEATILGIITPILDGLSEVHKTGLMHRDIKPGNIYLRNSGGPMLIDFGAARQALGEHSKSISAIISQGYAPPEQYTTRGKQGAFTDLYAIGATLYKLIVGKAPVESSDRSHAKAEGEPDPMTPATEAGKGKVSDWLLQLTDQLLNISARDRPQSAESVIEAIKNKTIVDLGVAATATAQPAPPQNDNKTRVVRSSDRFSKSASKSTSSASAGASAQDEKSKTGIIAAAVIAVVAITGGGWWFTQGGLQSDSGSSVSQSKTLAKGQSILFVESKPGDAEVYLDNILLGRTPYDNDQLPAGKHELKLVHKEAMDKVETISLSNNEITKKSYELEGAKGNISVFSTPSGAEIIIGGQKTGKRTPATVKDVRAGDWSLELKKEAYFTLKAPITVLKNQTTREDFTLEGGHLVKYDGEWIEPAEKESRLAESKAEVAARAKAREDEKARALVRRKAEEAAIAKKQEEEKARALVRRRAEEAQQQPAKHNIANATPVYKAPVVQGDHSAVKITAPDIAENGAVVPVTLSGLGLMPGESATLETDYGCSLFRITNKGKSVVDYFGTRIKLAKTQKIRVKLNDGRVVASKKVTVVIGGMTGSLGTEKSKRTASWSFIKEAHAAPSYKSSKACKLSQLDFDPSVVATVDPKMKIKAKQKEDYVEIKVMAKHPMETGLRKAKNTGGRISAHYIQSLSIQSGNEKILVATTASISKNPYFKVNFKGVRNGDTVTVAWMDNRDAGAKKSVKVK